MAKRSLGTVLGIKKRKRYGEGYEYKRDSFFSFKFTGSASHRLKRIFSSRIFKYLKDFSYFLSHVKAKNYGAMSMSFGLISLFLYFIGASADMGVSTPIISILLAILAIPFLLSEKSLPILLQDFKITDYVFYEFFCMKRANRIDAESKFPLFLSIAIGIILALFSYFIPVWQTVLTIGVIILTYISLASPEFPFFLSFLILPYFRYIPYSSICLVIMITVAIISFVRKIIYGKRVLHVESYDVLLALFTLLVLISGIFVKGMESFSSSVEMIVLAMGYTLASNIITNCRLADCALNAVIISSIPPSVISVVQYIIISARVGVSNIQLSDIEEIFVRRNELAPFLLVSIVMSVAMIIQNHRIVRTLYAVGVAINSLALVLTGEFFAVFTLIIGAFAYYVLKRKRLTIIVMPLLLIIPYLLLIIIPNYALDELFLRIPSLTTAEELFELWRSSVEAFSNNFFVGIGIGAESFSEEMINYGVAGHNDSSNIFIEIGLEAGVFALLTFMLLLCVRLVHRTRYYHYVKRSQTGLATLISELCVFCLLTFGATNYIWSDMSAYYLFWCIFGIGSAAIRVAKKEHDDMILYYEDTRAFDSSVIDVQIA